MKQAVGGGSEDWRRYFAALAHCLADGAAEGTWAKFPGLPHFLSEACERGTGIPLTEALCEHLSAVEPSFSDNKGRPTVSFWHELMTRQR